MTLSEVHRFRTPLVEDGGHLWWDIDTLWSEVQVGLARALEQTTELRSISVDSWAVDYVPLAADGTPVRRPYAYRDARTRGRLWSALARAGGADRVYDHTGIQFLELNTLVQVVADLADEPDLVARTATRLTMAEYVIHRLTGCTVAERTMASTTQLLNIDSGEWDAELLSAIGDDVHRWPSLVDPGTVIGPLRPELRGGAQGAGPQVIATCAHDTAAAVAAVPARADQQWAYISAGTWALVGVERREPVKSADARLGGFTNERGLDGTIRLLVNRMGMWVLEECIREWSIGGDAPSHDALVAEARTAPAIDHVLDLDEPTFAARGPMVERLRASSLTTGGTVPTTRGGIVRLVLESLAVSHARAIDRLERLTGERIEVVHIVGGPSRNTLLDQMTADACGRTVLAGPDEAAVLGNLLVQARTLGDLGGVTIREAARNSTTVTEFLPRSLPRAHNGATVPTTLTKAST